MTLRASASRTTPSSLPSLDALKKLAVALRVSADYLLFDEDERGPSDDLKLQFEAVSQLDDDDKEVVRNVLEGLLLKTRRRSSPSSGGDECEESATHLSGRRCVPARRRFDGLGAVPRQHSASSGHRAHPRLQAGAESPSIEEEGAFLMLASVGAAKGAADAFRFADGYRCSRVIEDHGTDDQKERLERLRRECDKDDPQSLYCRTVKHIRDTAGAHWNRDLVQEALEAFEDDEIPMWEGGDTFADRAVPLPREDRGLTQARLAELLDVSPRVYNRWENEAVAPRLLDVTLDELVGRQEPQESRLRIHNPKLHQLYQEIDRLSDEDQQALVILLDSLVKRSQMGQVMAG